MRGGSWVVRFGLAALLGAVLVGCGTSPSPTPATPAPSPSASDAPMASETAPASAEPTVAPSPDLSHRPFTVLVLGGDNDFRTDAIMVVGVDPTARTLAFASIPRDTIDVPLPGGGTFTNQKINAFYIAALKDPARYPQGAGRATADMVGTLLGIRIDHYAATSFGGFKNLVRAMGGVSITLPAPVVDPYYQTAPGHTGIRFPKGVQELDPDRSLIFVRTRQGDNDFARQRRQQDFLVAAGTQVLSKPELLAALLEARSNLITDLPLDELPALLATVGSVEPADIRHAVLGPSKYESSGTCPCGYALVPKLDEMRKLAASFFPWAVVPQTP